MAPDLRVLFERALDDEPTPPAGEPVREAMARGRRIRRRRGLLTAGAAAVVVVAGLAGVRLATAPAVPPPLSAAEAKLGPACTSPAPDADVSIFLDMDVTDGERDALEAGLRADPAVRALRFEDHERAYDRFKQLWADSPDFVAAVDPTSLPESFRIMLGDPAAYPAFAGRFGHRAGVSEILGRACPGTGR